MKNKYLFVSAIQFSSTDMAISWISDYYVKYMYNEGHMQNVMFLTLLLLIAVITIYRLFVYVK